MKIYRLPACIVGAVLILIGTYVFADTQENNNISSTLQLLLLCDEGVEEPQILNWISITGPTEVDEGEGAQYTCKAYYNDGSNHDVSISAQWSDNSSYASINTSGYLATTSVFSDKRVTITADYGEMSDTHGVTIVNIPLDPEDPEDPENGCADLSGALEVHILVGPAEIVGLEPFAVGSIPFDTMCDDDSCTVQGSGVLEYNETLGTEWGSYTVTVDLEGDIIGECVSNVSNDSLNLTVTVSGNQVLEVVYDGEQPIVIPKEVTDVRDVDFPIEEGATVEGEGWALVLHIN